MVKIAVALLVMAVSSPALAQNADANQMITLGAQVVQYVDQGKTSELWDGLSPAIKQISPKASFVSAVTDERRPLGLPKSRVWSSVAQITVPTSTNTLPAGRYLSVTFNTLFASGKAGVEQVSFRVDADNVWRCTGYTLRTN